MGNHKNQNNMDALIKTTDSKSSTFSTIYKTYSRKMYVYGISIGFCEYLCHDAVHDVFSSLLISKKTLEHIENLETYLLNCMKNRLFDIYRNEKSKHTIDNEEIMENNEEMFFDKLIAQENNDLMKSEVNRLLLKLPQKHRKIILFRFNHNLKFDEIAVVMHMSPEAVKKQLYRSLKMMRQEIKSNISNCYNFC